MDALERDFYEERRRKWRRSAFWRGFLFAILVLMGLSFAAALMTGMETTREHVALYRVEGIIGDDYARDRMLKKLEETETARAVIVRINSPGGSTAGAEALYAALRSIAKVKPVVAVMSEVAASGGYVAAIAADHIVARGNTLTGSIGVIMEYPDVTSIMERFGVSMQTVRSSELKAEPSPFRPTNPAARAVSEAMVSESYVWFRDLVGQRRNLSDEALDAVANGAVFTGRSALEDGLVDEIGGEGEALDWLESQQAGVSELPIVDWEQDEELGPLTRILGRIRSSSGIFGEISAWQGAKLYSIGP